MSNDTEAPAGAAPGAETWLGIIERYLDTQDSTKAHFCRSALASLRKCVAQPPPPSSQAVEARLTPEEIEANKQIARTQFKELFGPAMVTCRCGHRIPARFAYKCLYCDIFHCMACAEAHFGKSRAEYFAERHPARASLPPPITGATPKGESNAGP